MSHISHQELYSSSSTDEQEQENVYTRLGNMLKSSSSSRSHCSATLIRNEMERGNYERVPMTITTTETGEQQQEQQTEQKKTSNHFNDHDFVVYLFPASSRDFEERMRKHMGTWNIVERCPWQLGIGFGAAMALLLVEVLPADVGKNSNRFLSAAAFAQAFITVEEYDESSIMTMGQQQEVPSRYHDIDHSDDEGLVTIDFGDVQVFYQSFYAIIWGLLAGLASLFVCYAFLNGCRRFHQLPTASVLKPFSQSTFLAFCAITCIAMDVRNIAETTTTVVSSTMQQQQQHSMLSVIIPLFIAVGWGTVLIENISLPKCLLSTDYNLMTESDMLEDFSYGKFIDV